MRTIQIVKHLIKKSDLYIIAAKSSKHIPHDKTTLTLKDLLNYPLIKYNFPPSSDGIWTKLSNFGTPNFVLKTTNSTIYYQAIVNDLGLGLLLKYGVNYGLIDRNTIRFIPLQEKVSFYLYLVHHKNYPHEKANSIIQMLLTNLK